MTEVLDDGAASLTLRDYVCAVCWSELDKSPAPGRMWTVQCSKYGDEHQGFVTKTYVELRQQRSHLDCVEATRTLQKVGILPTPPRKSERQLLEELGY